ncbi:MAG: hypothetical protein ACO1OB_28760 [Archangium sp.]
MRALKAVAKLLLGLIIGLVIAEIAFTIRDDGAFPHLNLYVADADLGVKLEPNASLKLRVAGTNPVTTVRTNSLGFRGNQWLDPTPGEVLVVGDSQVFGLGVEETETFSARLSEFLKVPVLNAGVPTYGPREYTAVVENVLRTRKPATVIYVMNLSNDLFEVDRPNNGRHVVWDGWAVRTETAPKDVVNFPFRHTLMNRSHLVFGLRKLLHTSADAAANPGFDTEGSWKDVVTASTGVKAPPPQDEATRKMLGERDALARELDILDTQIADALSDGINDDDETFVEGVKPLIANGGDPRDILEVRYAEGARRIDVTAYELFAAAVGLDRNQATLEKLAKSNPGLKAMLEKRKELRGRAGTLHEGEIGLDPRPVDAVLEKTRAACDAVGAKLVVIALPLDVMVDANEWKKYGVQPIDMSVTKVLIEDLVARSNRLGARGMDPTAALAAAEPGAFLDGDLHMTPKGHAALAKFIADELAKPPPPKSALALPDGRSWPPTEDEWRRVDECTVKGSSALNCETKQVREWVRILCRPMPDPENEARELPVRELVTLSGGRGDVLIFENQGATLIAPVLEGDEVKARFSWDTEQRELTLAWPKGGKRQYAFGDAKKIRARRNREGVTYMPPQDAYRSPLALVKCPENQATGGAMRRCAPKCDDATPCADGQTCHPWINGGFCGN